MNTIGFGEVSAFALDMDGTLANTVPTHNAARLEAFKQMAELTGDERFVAVTPEIQAEAHRHGSNPVAIIGWVLQEAGIVVSLDDEKVMQTVQLKKQLYAELAAQGLDEYPGATNFARDIMVASRGRAAIVTTAHKDTEAVPFLRRYHLDEVFNGPLLVAFEDVGQDHVKPDPKAYHIILDRFGLSASPEKLLVVEDTHGGIEAAKTAGARTVAIATTHTREELEALGGIQQPDFIVDDFKQLSDLCAIAGL